MKKKEKTLWPTKDTKSTVKFRCGGVAAIRKYWFKKDEKYYPHCIRLEGYHAGDDFWSYNDEGEHGQGTGPEDGNYPFDILSINWAGK